MVDSDDGKTAESRPPTLNDLLRLCRALNNAGAKYIVVGGMAMIEAGYVRATEDIDLLVDVSNENQNRASLKLIVKIGIHHGLVYFRVQFFAIDIAT